MIILIHGLPGSGKTTLSKALAQQIGAVHLNADEIRKEINKDLKFSPEDRVEQARRMGVLADIVSRSGKHVIADFVCPTKQTRNAFWGVPNPDNEFEIWYNEPRYRENGYVVWVDRIDKSRFEDTNKLFEPAGIADMVVTEHNSPEYWANRIAADVAPAFDPKKPTALFVGRYQPFHPGHRALIEEGIRRVGQACIGIRDTQGTSAGNPYSPSEVEASIRVGMAGLEGKYSIVHLPNITDIMYGRDVGYKIEQIVLADAVQAVSATALRQKRNG